MHLSRGTSSTGPRCIDLHYGVGSAWSERDPRSGIPWRGNIRASNQNLPTRQHARQTPTPPRAPLYLLFPPAPALPGVPVPRGTGVSPRITITELARQQGWTIDRSRPDTLDESRLAEAQDRALDRAGRQMRTSAPATREHLLLLLLLLRAPYKRGSFFLAPSPVMIASSSESVMTAVPASLLRLSLIHI